MYYVYNKKYIFFFLFSWINKVRVLNYPCFSIVLHPLSALTQDNRQYTVFSHTVNKGRTSSKRRVL